MARWATTCCCERTTRSASSDGQPQVRESALTTQSCSRALSRGRLTQVLMIAEPPHTAAEILVKVLMIGRWRSLGTHLVVVLASGHRCLEWLRCPAWGMALTSTGFSETSRQAHQFLALATFPPPFFVFSLLSKSFCLDYLLYRSCVSGQMVLTRGKRVPECTRQPKLSQNAAVHFWATTGTHLGCTGWVCLVQCLFPTSATVCHLPIMFQPGRVYASFLVACLPNRFRQVPGLGCCCLPGMGSGVVRPRLGNDSGLAKLKVYEVWGRGYRNKE